MKRSKEFPFERARRVTSAEVEAARKAIEKAEGVKRPKRTGRPPKKTTDKYVAVSIRLHPLVLSWARREAKKRGLPYQSLINEVLLKEAA